MELFEIENMLDDLAEEIEPHLELTHKFLMNLKSTDKPLSIFSMSSFFPKIESIRIGIFEVSKANEYYSLNILFRSIIEHFVKAQYIWMKTLANKNDEIGIDYWVFGQDQENIDYAKAIHQSYSLIGISPDTTPVEALKIIGILSKEKSANEISKRYEQFKYKNMTHYIAEQLKTKSTGSAPILMSIFPRYSELSSFVHGGPDSVRAYENGAKETLEIIEMATFASLYTRWLSCILFFQYEKDIEPLCRISQKYLFKFTQHNKTHQETETASTD